MNYYTEYNDVGLSKLKGWERQVIGILKEAVKICGLIYAKQKNASCAGGNFYPCDVPKEQIESASKTNPEILSPYTMVEIGSNGELVGIKYSVKFKDEIAQMCKIVEEVSEVYKANGFDLYSAYLKQISLDLKNDNYEESEKIWLKIDWKVKVDIKFGPIETYQDKLFGVKKAFQANLRITDDVDSNNIGEYIDLAYALADISRTGKRKKLPSEKNLIVRVDKIIAASGWHADLTPRTSDYPKDMSQIGNGSKILIYTNNIALKQKIISQIISEIFILSDSDLAGNYDIAAIRVCTLHEICETVSRQEHPEDYGNFGGIEDSFTELNASMASIKIASHQVLKGVFSAEDYKYLIIEFLAGALRGWIYGKSTSSGLRLFSDSYKVILNLLIEKGALKITKTNRIEIDLNAVYAYVDILNKNLHTYLISRDKEAVENLFLTYSSNEELDKLSETLGKIVFKK
ncbi:hypothetical protein A2713_00775 [candidate division WWE3 bacterium RIFCSPHIGHO2_01_FULL_35_17]|uniref:Uncharacterized protein n=1 Tax=candidate division WWE3 bacterium RIFCSPHIGHO2_01_FULL_35_17 TaxID=1802614 RepID=A0A1F4UT43_UNCKA|nr:MAG: hypothetical protein A2713_00775 [candidate division WWE3 bacterium RIFCSPHIGHO2_01_FULL_35_17]